MALISGVEYLLATCMFWKMLFTSSTHFLIGLFGVVFAIKLSDFFIYFDSLFFIFCIYCRFLWLPWDVHKTSYRFSSLFYADMDLASISLKITLYSLPFYVLLSQFTFCIIYLLTIIAIDICILSVL